MSYFGNIDGLMDADVRKIWAAVAANREQASDALAEAMGNTEPNGARLRKLLLGQAVENLPLLLENIPAMTDDEFVAAYEGAGVLDLAKFKVQLSAAGALPLVSRVNQLRQMVERQRLAEKAEAEKKAREAVAIAQAEERQKILADPVQAVNHPTIAVPDETAIRYIQARSEKFQPPEALLDELMARRADGKVQCLLSKEWIPEGDAAVIRLFFVCKKPHAGRLVKKLPSLPGRGQDRYYSISETLHYLNDAAKQRAAEQAELDDFRQSVRSYQTFEVVLELEKMEDDLRRQLEGGSSRLLKIKLDMVIRQIAWIKERPARNSGGAKVIPLRPSADKSGQDGKSREEELARRARQYATSLGRSGLSPADQMTLYEKRPKGKGGKKGRN